MLNWMLCRAVWPAWRGVGFDLPACCSLCLNLLRHVAACVPSVALAGDFAYAAMAFAGVNGVAAGAVVRALPRAAGCGLEGAVCGHCVPVKAIPKERRHPVQCRMPPCCLA